MKFLQCPFDEFNYYPVVNFYKEFLDEDSNIVTFKGLECLYPFYKNIITIDMPNNILELTPEQKWELILNKIKTFPDYEIISYQFCIDSIHKNEHVYKFLFGNYTKYLFEHGIMFKPNILNLYDCAKKMFCGNKRVVCVNGRNINRNEHRNNLLIDLIKRLISDDYFVINVTLNKPNLNLSSKNYLEPDNLLDYGNVMAYFKLSDCVISLSDSAGISTHLMTDSNLILIGEGGWVDNPEFGYIGYSMVTARQDYCKQKTIRVNNYNINDIMGAVYEFD